MKVREFLNEAWLHGRFNDPKSVHILSLLQEFFDNNNAEVYAFTGGLLVLDIKDPGYAKVTRAMQEEGGKLYFIDNNHERQVLLTDYESRDELLVYSTIFMSDPTYYQTKRGPERFIDEYNKGLLGGLKASKNGSQPGEN